MAEEKAMYEGGVELWSRPSRYGTYPLLTRTWPAIYSLQISIAPASDECGSTIGICGPRHEAVKASPTACNCLFQMPVLRCLLLLHMFSIRYACPWIQPVRSALLFLPVERKWRRKWYTSPCFRHGRYHHVNPIPVSPVSPRTL